ncbi:MASE1 domain-containing protein [Breoghania sp.]|uniref:MASE1 domain-containing protein n=1 Tax=Breoghania sp. TaxID=2065378 RepID=UPI0026293216|nr:MASE1 domain-containing protein [Breoghania sp.]MDJ0933315.1 MASE1 domain-containing protein [Breoghania sp.]
MKPEWCNFASGCISRVVLLALIYVLTGKLGLLLAAFPGYATLIWPLSGIAVGALILCDQKIWPGVFLGSFALNAIVGGANVTLESWINADLWTAAVIAGGSTLQVITAHMLVRSAFGKPIRLEKWGDVGKLTLFAGPVSCVIAASIGTFALYSADSLSAEQFWDSWTTWWLGDVIGVLLLPLTLFAAGQKGTIVWRGQQVGNLPGSLLLILVIPLAATFYAWHEISQNIYDRVETQFSALAEENEVALRNRTAAYETGLRSGVGFLRRHDGHKALGMGVVYRCSGRSKVVFRHQWHRLHCKRDERWSR